MAISGLGMYNMPEYNPAKLGNAKEAAAAKQEEKTEQESKTDSEIIVNSDGSKVLEVTTKVDGIEASMILKLSNPPVINKAGLEQKAGNLASGIVGFAVVGSGKNVQTVAAYYDETSTKENPVMDIRVSDEAGNPTASYKINVADIDTENATQLEMFALYSHRDAQANREMNYSYQNFLQYAADEEKAGFYANNIYDYAHVRQNWPEILI